MSVPDHTIILPETVTLGSVATLRTEIDQTLLSAHSLTIDTAPLKQADLSFLQLMLAARRSAAERGATLTIAAPAEGELHRLAGIHGVAADLLS